jgi:hypothetical protein
MPWGLKRFQQSGQLHFLTFSCYRRRANFQSIRSRATFEASLETVRQGYRLWVYGYVVMPEHVHLLVNEPQRCGLARALQSLKQSVARTPGVASCGSLLAGSLLRFSVDDGLLLQVGDGDNFSHAVSSCWHRALHAVNGAGQAACLDHGAAGESAGPLQAVFQFTNVAWPIVG